MARIEDIPEPTRTSVLNLACASPDTHPLVGGPPLAQRRVAIITSAALHSRHEPPFVAGSTGFRPLASSLPAGDIVMSHVSINFDRYGFQRDLNVVFPIDRLREFAAAGWIGAVADTHYSVLGSTDPAGMTESADQLAALLQGEGVDAVLLSPV